MNKNQIKICIFWSIVFVLYIISCTIHYQGFLVDFIHFIVFLSSGIGILSLFAPMFLEDIKEPTKEQKICLILFPLIGGIIVSFGIYYSSTVFKLKERYDRLRDSYTESFYNVQELVEDGTYYHPDFFIDAFSNYSDYIDY